MKYDKLKCIDLSQPLYNGIPLAGVLPRFVMYRCLDVDAGDSVNSYSSILADHTGTHCDAPFHMFREGKTLDQYPVDSCSGKAICLDVLAYDEKAITIDAIKEAEKKCREVQNGDIVLLCTNHSRWWGKIPEGYAYLQNRPWVDPSAAQYFIDKGVKAVGIDVGGPDPLGGTHIIHEMLLSNDILIVESLANLTEVLNKEFFFAAFPIKLTGTSGAPTRAVAIIEEE